MTRRTSRGRLVIAALGIASAAGMAAFQTLRSQVAGALDPPVESSRPMRWSPLPPGDEAWFGADRVEDVALAGDALVAVGGFGVWEQRPGDVGAGDGGAGAYVRAGLPTLSASAVTRWRGRLVVALASGGLYLREGRGWQELVSGYGALHVRTLHESDAGELLAGAAEGLFRATVGGSALERLHDAPVRTIASSAARIVAGGERGLVVVEAGRATPVATPDPWVESVALAGDVLRVVTLRGLASGPLGGELAPVRGGEDLVSGVLWRGAYVGISSDPGAPLRRIEAGGHAGIEDAPGIPRKLIVASGELFAATDRGLFHRGSTSWELVRAPQPSELGGGGHVGALAAWRRDLAVGLFDGGLVLAEGDGASTAFRPAEAPGNGSGAPVAETPGVWGVNALCSVAGELWIASLRGAARYDGARVTALDGPGAAFSLARTPDGVAIGYAQGVKVPGKGLVSAFHGLPGNQATALASGPLLYVGTPSGLGGLARTRVAWRVTPGQDELPHAWVTSLALAGDDLWIGTYGGGIARRTSGAGHLERFPETAGKKVTCLLAAGGELYAGTEGEGLWRAVAEGGAPRFRREAVRLPSTSVTALALRDGALWIGTTEGLARMPARSAIALARRPGA